MLRRTAIAFLLFLSMSALAFAAGPKTYQVTGPVLAINGNVITVQKGAEKWELAIDKNTKTTGDLKVGAKVTIEYQMTATTITAKPAATNTAGPAAKRN